MGKTIYADSQVGARISAVAYVPAAATADATKEWPVFCAPDSCKILQVQIIPQATITGTATNYFNLNLRNKGAAGAGTTELGNIDFLSGTNATGYDAKDIVADTAHASATALSQGDVLGLQRELVLTGLAMPELIVLVTYILT